MPDATNIGFIRHGMESVSRFHTIASLDEIDGVAISLFPNQRIETAEIALG
jgi:hypothetical protein